jgi:hypothetical protein
MAFSMDGSLANEDMAAPPARRPHQSVRVEYTRTEKQALSKRKESKSRRGAYSSTIGEVRTESASQHVE